jgi:ubiquinone/menaquinone biosynthesis C-methylase UbiE
MAQERLYDDLAWLWPVLSPVEDYVEESDLFARLLSEAALGPVRSVLHLASGGGHIDHRLKERFDVTGVDRSGAMVDLACDLNPDVDYEIADMRDVRLGRSFDAVLIDDGVVYATSPEDLRAVFETAFVHLRPGGSMLVYVEYEPSSFRQNSTTSKRRVGGGIDLVCIENIFDPDPSDTVVETTYLYLVRRDGGLTVEVDRHICGMFPLKVWRELLRETGFTWTERRFEHTEHGPDEEEPMFVCTRPMEEGR